MRIASLVPSATEILFELGLGDQVVGVTHECDWPPGAEQRPHLTRSVIAEGLGEREIDRAVRELTSANRALYELDGELLERLEVDLIVTQAVCEVCAVSYDDVVAVAAELPRQPRVVSLDPSSLEQVLTDVARLAQVAGVPELGSALLARSRERIDKIAARTAKLDHPSTVAIEWLDPLFAGGHWVPEMIALAGGTDRVGRAAEKSRTVHAAELRAASPEVVVVMPCGYDTTTSHEHALLHGDLLASLDAKRAYAVDAAAYFSRPGPRLVDGVELLAKLLHPQEFGSPDPRQAIELAI